MAKCALLQNHVWCNDAYKIFWTNTKAKLPNVNNDDGAYKPDAVQMVCNTFFNHIVSDGCPFASGGGLLHDMLSGKKKSKFMSPENFSTHFQKVL